MKIEGVVVHGKQLGRTIGFPTANVEIRQQSGSGPDGVYAAFFEVDGARLPCMVNIGHHPTLPEGGKTVEAHIIGYSGDAYGKNVTVDTVAFIRPEQKFGSVEELRLQLERDKNTTIALLSAKTQASPPCRHWGISMATVPYPQCRKPVWPRGHWSVISRPAATSILTKPAEPPKTSRP